MFILAVLLLILLLLSCLILSLHCGDPSASMHTQSDQTQTDVGAQLFTIQWVKHVQRNFLVFRQRRLNPVIMSVSRTCIDTPRMLAFLSLRAASSLREVTCMWQVSFLKGTLNMIFQCLSINQKGLSHAITILVDPLYLFLDCSQIGVADSQTPRVLILYLTQPRNSDVVCNCCI